MDEVKKLGRPKGSKNRRGRKPGRKPGKQTQKISGADLQELTHSLCVVHSLLMAATTLLNQTLRG